MSVGYFISAGRMIVRRLANACLRPVEWLAGWTFPGYFTFRDKVKVMTVGIEPDLQGFVRREIKAGECVLDIGANVGYLARLFSCCVGKKGRVLAFEPEPENVKALTSNLKRFTQASVYSLAMTDYVGTADFYLNRVSGTGNSLVPHPLGTREITVPCSTLDQFLEEHPDVHPDWVKIDVEGGEFHVLRGMKAAVRQFPGLKVIIELCPLNLGGEVAAERLVKELRGLDLVLHVICQDGSARPYENLAQHGHLLADSGYVNLYGARTVTGLRLVE
jgi:FkbM family methyltransferase